MTSGLHYKEEQRQYLSPSCCPYIERLGGAKVWLGSRAFINLDRISRDSGELFRKPSSRPFSSSLPVPAPPFLSSSSSSSSTSSLSSSYFSSSELSPPLKPHHDSVHPLDSRRKFSSDRNAVDSSDQRLNSDGIACQSYILIIH